MLLMLGIVRRFFDKILGRICPLHECPLDKGSVPIHFGLMRRSTEYLQAKDKLFPLANSHRLGACILVPGRHSVLVTFCPRCREAEKEWVESNPVNFNKLFGFLEFEVDSKKAGLDSNPPDLK